MNESDDRVDAVIEAFLDHLDGTGDEPPLDDLDAQERARVDEVIRSLKAGRGIDPYASRPSLEQVLAGTPLESALHGGVPQLAPHHDLLGEVRDQLTLYAPFHVDIWQDATAAGIGVSSDFVALIGAYRLRIQIRSVREPSSLASLDPAAAAGPIYGAFPDTAGVVVMCPNDDLSSVAIDPFDTEYCIESPTGAVEQPATHRPVLPLADTVRRYLDELAPALDTTVDFDSLRAEEVDRAIIARAAAARAVENIVADGRRAKIDGKRVIWSGFGEAEIGAISNLVIDSIAGLDPMTIESRIVAVTDAA